MLHVHFFRMMFTIENRAFMRYIFFIRYSLKVPKKFLSH